MAEHYLDAKGLKCPLPVLKARKAMKQVEGGQILEIEATDPGSVEDFRHYCETTGDELVGSHRTEEGAFVFRIRKSAR